MRKLASIQKVENLRAIPGADAIEVCNIQGFDVVVKKGEYKNGDEVVYCETDSILPEKPEFEFLRNKNFRIKILKLRGQVSEGIIFSKDILPKGDYVLGQDVTEILGVVKYDNEKEEEISVTKKHSSLMKYKWYRRIINENKNKGNFPSFIAKTDETRLQNKTRVLNTDEIFDVTEKLEGQSATYAIVRNKLNFVERYLLKKSEFEFFICSRSLRRGINDGSNWSKIAKQLNIEEKLIKMITDDEDMIAIQGEIIGEGIQGNIYGIKGLDFYGFNLIRRKKDQSFKTYLGFEIMQEIFKKVELKTVPYLGIMYSKGKTVSDLVELSKGTSKLANTRREGLVFRTKNIGSLEKESFKVINPDYLLKSNL